MNSKVGKRNCESSLTSATHLTSENKSRLGSMKPAVRTMEMASLVYNRLPGQVVLPPQQFCIEELLLKEGRSTRRGPDYTVLPTALGTIVLLRCNLL